MFGRRDLTRSDRPKVVLLTGASRGIGRSTALALAREGFHLGLVDRDEGALHQIRDELRNLNRVAHAVTADVSDSAAMREGVQILEGTLGQVDVLVACAGVGGLSSATDLDLDGLRDMLLINVLGVANAIAAVLPGMYARKSGHVVGISSVAGWRGMPWMPGYSASKAALSTYLEGLRPSLKRRGVRVTTVNPGFVRTGLTVQTPFRRPVPMMEPDEAARHVVRAVLRQPREYTFPWSTALGMAFLRATPHAIYDWMMDRAGPRALLKEF